MEGGVTPFSSSMAPSGSYILIVVGQPLTEEHKQTILERLNKGLLSWDVSSTGCDLSGLENAFSSIIKERIFEGDVLIQHSTESLGVEVLLNPTVRTLKQCVKNLLSTATSHKQLIHAGYTFAGSGSWIMENGTFSFAEFLEIFQQVDVQNQKKCTLNVHCAEEGEWKEANFSKDIFKAVDIALNPSEKVSHVPGSEHLIKCLNNVLVTQSLNEIMEPSPLVGNIRFNRPTIYMFPAGQGDCALFGVNGFNMLIDGGFHRKPCSWEFVRHLDRLDAVLVTRIGESNVCGISTLMKRNALNNANPQIGYVFCNISENKMSPKNGNQEAKDDLIVSVVGEGHEFVQTLNDLKLKPHQCWRDSSIDPFVLYHKVGQGTLEMHVLSPPRDSKDMKKFLTEWNDYKETFTCVKSDLKGVENIIPLSHATSICAILVWRPEDPKDTITRILFPGSAPQSRILEGLDKLKSLNILNQPIVTKSSLVNMPPTKIISAKVEKSVSRASIPSRKNTASPALSMSSIASRNGDIGILKKDVKEVKKVVKEVKKEVKKEIKKDTVKEVKKDIKTENLIKKDVLSKKEAKKEIKEVKKVIKKDNKDVKAVIEKKTEIKSTPKKESTSLTTKTNADVKKNTTAKKSITPTKKDVGKPPIAPKTIETRKSLPKVSEPKTTKDINNKKTTDVKTVSKTKPKATPTATKIKSTTASKPGTKMSKAVAASSVVASAVAVTVAAFELNEKTEEIADVEAEIPEKEVEEKKDLKKAVVDEKVVEDIVSPLPPEALSPTPSESVSLTPSDTLSSAPLETVSPTPPLQNEPVSTEEKDVNEIKDIEQDMPYEPEVIIDEDRTPNLDEEHIEEINEVNNSEVKLTQQQTSSDVMNTSFIGNQQVEDEEVNLVKTGSEENESISKSYENEKELSEKYVNIEETEKEVVEEKDVEVEHLKNDFANENDVVEEEEIAEEKDVMAEKDVIENITYNDEIVKEKDTYEEKEVLPEDISDIIKDNDSSKDFTTENSTVEEKNDAYENKLSTMGNKKEIGDQLASVSMEGSFCAEITCVDENILSATNNESTQMNEEDNSIKTFDDYIDENVTEEQMHEKKIIFENENYLQTQTNTLESEEIQADQELNKMYSNEEIDKISEESTENYESQKLEELHSESTHYSYEDKIQQDNEINYDTNEKVEQHVFHDKVTENKEIIEHAESEHVESQFNKISQIQSMEESFHQDMHDNYEDTPNIDDLEMQETSVDEPEEIIRKESAVSVTLNDENLEETYMDNWRRKSGTESEDDVDIGKYMSKEQIVDEEKLHIQHDTDSDEEDVVKSPTPHAIVNYEGQLDETISDVNESHETENATEIIKNDKDVYLTEKQDFDEKDRDSAEDQDTDDGEMIVHPIPQDMKYSEKEMQDPIGQHFIANPILNQGTDITEQPLYEEAEDSESERSASPIIEQPVFGNTAQADFPELVTVSGGTTPSEPQSPKASFDAKKFTTETVIMDALSEHDISESSTHSPSCQDGSTAFDLQVSEKSVIDVQSLQDDSLINAVDESINNKADFTLDTIPKAESEVIEEPKNIEISMYEDNEDNQEEKKDTPSDEEESSSEDENSESHSKDKSDAMGDRSDVERDDRSDMHNDDKSDPHNDGKSDIANDDDDKSDIQENEQLYKQQDSHVFHYSDDVSVENIKSDFQNTLDVHMKENEIDENQFNCEKLENQPESSEMYEHQISFQHNADEMKHDINLQSNLTEPELTIDERDVVFPETAEEYTSDINIIPSHDNQNTQFDYETHENLTHDDSKITMEYESTNDLVVENFELPMTSNESFINTELITSDKDLQSYSYNDQEYTITKKDDNSNAFRTNEDPIEINKHTSDIYGFNTSDHEIENKTTTLEQTDIQISNVPTYLQEIPKDFASTKNVPLDQQENKSYDNCTDLHEDISPPHIENFNVMENKILSEMSEAQQYEKVSQYEENIHTSNEIYSESTLIQNIVSGEENYLSSEKSNVSDINFEYTQREIKSLTTIDSYEYSSSAVDDKMDDVNKFYQEDICRTDVHDIKNPDVSHNTESTGDIFKSSQQFEHPPKIFEEYNEYSDMKIQFQSQNESAFMQCSEENVEVLPKNDLDSGVADINFNDKDNSINDEESNYTILNGKNEASQNAQSTEITSQIYGTELVQKETIINATQPTEQESSYLISNRFHSDSPEDNTMRSDSSPDVPYPADLTEKFSGIKNSFTVETSETYLNNTDDFKNNMNFSNTDDLPLSPNKRSLNANDNNLYAESSEDESNSLVHGNTSPYAYTNKAYTREEEDIDGNHIYKEETTEITKQLEFDGNNLQTLNTNQVESVMNYPQEIQDAQYNTGANYDFHLEEWGKPMGLPTPPDASQKTVTKKIEKSTLKSKTVVDTNGKAHSPSVSSKLSSPLKKPKPKIAKESSSSPVYVDLAYVPQHADPDYCDVEFFKKIRARYYVLSSVNPSKEVLNALLEAKKTWNEDLNVTIIPTYETDTLGYWMAQNRDDLDEYSIDVSPSASRCTVNLQDHQTSCSAYRLEF